MLLFSKSSKITVLLQFASMIIFVVNAALLSSCALADDADPSVGRFGESILDEEPFDVITLKEEESFKEFKVQPIKSLPNRKVPTNPDPESDLEIVLSIYPDRVYKISWKDVGKLELYEDLLVSEANRLVKLKQFAPAFEHLSMLMNNYPKTAGLDRLRQQFLISSAQEMRKNGKLPQSLAILEEFVRIYPKHANINQVKSTISSIANEMIEKFFNEGELVTAKKMLSRLERDYQASPIAAVAKWKKRFIEYAETFRKKAIEYQEQGNFPDARNSATRMLDIEPNIEGGKEFLQSLIDAYPLVRVAVFQSSTRMDSTEIADWPVRRSGALVSRSLFEFRDTGPEGGVYKMSLGSFTHSDDRTELELKFQNTEQPGVPNAFDISQWMLRRADVSSNEYRPSWSSILKDVTVLNQQSLLIKLRRPHVLPAAFLQWSLDGLGQQSTEANGLYIRGDDRSNGQKSFRWARQVLPNDVQPREILEIDYTSPKKAIGDLIKGDIEIIDRLFPADADTLKSTREVRVEPYALPMVHMLVPKSKHEFLMDRDFRRLLLYGINRQAILDGEILGGKPSASSSLISGPFPIGESENDPLSYAYNKAILPMPYDPRLAQVLVKITSLNLEKMAIKKKLPKPEIQPIRIGVPNYESARVAGQAFIQQWKTIGIPAELVVLESGANASDSTKPIDLLYVSAALWEPATDAERLFGIGGIAETDNVFIVQVLTSLRSAKNWREVRQYCQDLHRLVNDHLPILPLWQVRESFAYRANLQGIPATPVVLYQDVQKWRIKATVN